MRSVRFPIMAVALSALLLNVSAAHADDLLRVAATGSGAWDASVAEFGLKAGFFKEVGIELEISRTEGSTAALQAVISDSVDVALVGVAGFIGAAVQGAPLKMFSSNFTGLSDLLWYVRADSAIKSLSDMKEGDTIGSLNPGSTTFIVASALLEQYGVKGTVVPAGSAAANLTQVMTGQLTVGWDGNGGLGVLEFQRGEVRVIAYGTDLASMRDVTARGMIATEDTIETRRDVLVRYLQAYEKTIDWMYSDPKAIEWFAELNRASIDDAKEVVATIYPRSAMNLGEVRGIAITVEQGLRHKRISEAPTSEQLEEMFDIVWRPDQQ